MEENAEQRTQNKILRNNLENPQQIEMEENAEHGEGKQRKRHQGRRRIRNTQTINQKKSHLL